MSDTTIPDDEAGQVRLVLDIMKSIVDEAGHDFVYQRPAASQGDDACWYVHPETGQPDCLIGRVLHRLGVPLDVLKQQEGVGPELLDQLDSPIWLGAAALSILARAQYQQDNQKPWGDALAAAQAFAKEYGVTSG